MAIPDSIQDDDDEHRLPLLPACTRRESHKDTFFSDRIEHQLFYGPAKLIADELYDAEPLNGPGDALERLRMIQRLQSSLDALTSVLLADSTEQVSESLADTIATQDSSTEEEEREVTPRGLNSIVVPGSVKRVDQFDHVSDHCPKRPRVIPLPQVRLTPEGGRLLELKPHIDIPDKSPGTEPPHMGGQRETGQVP
ncbi:hypothetical protein [Glutamicibacter nicotianae]|uniref:hypothetical protein n=1 Tax=Glutamicibacter nicotianae TaxID=37929 RepID=UPI0019595AF4|nr:hypothetical protein [Glutamicibacter nicotianae]MBM7768420.1 hypothetical protein [Glutamicibacter nicotianae]